MSCAGPGRLTPGALLGIIDDVASAVAVWAHLVEHDPGQRSTLRLVATDLYEVWLLGWTPGQHVELHDHGPSHAAFQVVDGTLTELVREHGGIRRLTVGVGSRRTVPSGTVHDVLNDSSSVATSVHAYSPPLSAMTFYDATATRPLRSERIAPTMPVLGGLDLGPNRAVPQLARQ
jgi:Cysteine dioxygenase type I